LGVPFGFDFFSLSFLQKALDEDVHHVDELSRLGDVHVSFGSSFNVLFKSLPIYSIVLPFSQVFKTNLPLSIWFSQEFLKSFWARIILNALKIP